MLLQPILINDFRNSKGMFRQQCAKLLPSARTYQIDNIHYYVRNVLKWEPEDAMGMKGLCLKLPYSVCLFQFEEKMPLSYHLKSGNERKKHYCSVLAAYSESNNLLCAVISTTITPHKSDHEICGFVKCKVDENGILQERLSVKLYEDDTKVDLTNMVDARLISLGMRIMVPVMYAITLLTCKNVRDVEHVERKEMNTAGTKHYSNEQFRIIDVPLINRIYSGEIPLSTLGAKKGLHTVAGHFKVFTPEKPLLGKHVGRWWWDHQVRGSLANGIVQKEYRAVIPLNPKLQAALKGVV